MAKEKENFFTLKEELQIFSAATRTWSVISIDAAQLRATDIASAIELVLDAGRIVDIGKLSNKLYFKLTSLPVSTQDAFMIKNRNQWY